jgi:hypothetical protein
MDFFFTELDNLSNTVMPYLLNNEFEKAEAVCIQLVTEYPDMIDGIERFADFYQAKADFEKTTAYHEKIISYHFKTLRYMKEHPGFDSRYIDSINEKITKLLDELDELDAE